MSIILLLAAGGLLVMPGVVRRRMSRLAPSERAKLGFLSLLSGMASLGLALLVCATPVLFGILGFRPIGLVGAQHFFPGGTVAGWVSIVMLSVLIGAGLAAIAAHLISQHRLGAAAGFADVRVVHGTAVRVLPTQDPLAFALPGSPDSVVVSQGVIDRLDPAQLAAVLRHESSHLTHHHGWYLLVADLVERVFGMIPAVSRSTSSLRLAVEQWADDDSILVPADRLVVSGAMRRMIGLPAGPTVAAFAQADLVASRLHYLEDNPETPAFRSRVLMYVATAAGLAGGIGSLLFWAI